MMLILVPFTITSNADAALAELEAMDAAIQRALEAAVKKTATQIGLSTTRAMQRLIYDQPLPESMRRRGQERTGALLAGETVVENDPLNYEVTTEDRGVVDSRGREKNPTEYVHWRHEYQGLPAPWRTQGLEDIAGELEAIANSAFNEALGQAISGTTPGPDLFPMPDWAIGA